MFTALGLDISWLALSQLMACQDQSVKVREWAEQEISSLNKASTLFGDGHYDLSVI